MKEADLMRDQQRALAVQREEEVKIRKQQEMLEIEASQQREHQQQGMQARWWKVGIHCIRGMDSRTRNL